jgi:predicted dehydrogenase
MHIFLSTPTDYMTSREDHWAHKLPGGVIGESGPHVVYITLAFIPRIESVRVQATHVLDYPWSRFDDYRIELIGEGASSSIASVYTSNQWAAEVDLWGTSGRLSLDLETMALISHDRATLDHRTVATSALKDAASIVGDTVRVGARVLSRRYHDTHRVLVERFVDSINSGRPSPVPPEEGREAVRVMGLIVDQLDGKALRG